MEKIPECEQHDIHKMIPIIRRTMDYPNRRYYLCTKCHRFYCYNIESADLTEFKFNQSK